MSCEALKVAVCTSGAQGAMVPTESRLAMALGRAGATTETQRSPRSLRASLSDMTDQTLAAMAHLQLCATHS